MDTFFFGVKYGGMTSVKNLRHLTIHVGKKVPKEEIMEIFVLNLIPIIIWGLFLGVLKILLSRKEKVSASKAETNKVTVPALNAGTENIIEGEIVE